MYYFGRSRLWNQVLPLAGAKWHDLLCGLEKKELGSLYEFRWETGLQMNETFGAVYPLKSFGSMNNVSHCLRVIPEQESSALL